MTPLLAEMDPTQVALYGAITAVLMAIANGIQSYLKEKKEARTARLKKAADDAAAAALKKTEAEKAAELKRHVEEQAQAVAATTVEQVKDVKQTMEKALNGEGLGGKIDALRAEVAGIRQWQADHDVQDNLRHDDMLARVLGLKRADGDDKPRAGG